MARHQSSRKEDHRPPKRDRRPPSHAKPGKGPTRKPQEVTGGPPRARSEPDAKAKAPGQTRSGQGRAPRSTKPSVGQPQRLQKILAHAGLGSRRDCEEYILQGRVTVDGAVVRELGTRVDAEKSTITVDGERIQLEKMVYYAVNKPKGCVSTNHDPSGRPRVIDLLPEVPERVYSVGRLDEDSMGLMILTNDGELANRLAHPRYGVEKTYRALVAGTPEPEIVNKLVEGIWLSDGKLRARRARIVGTRGEATTLELVLAEGKKREIRRMLAKLGHKVMSLTRIAIGPVMLKGLSPGEHRPLSHTEIDLLRKVAAGIAVKSPQFRDQGERRRPEGRGARRKPEAPQVIEGHPPRPKRSASAGGPVQDRPPRDHLPRPASPRAGKPGDRPALSQNRKPQAATDAPASLPSVPRPPRPAVGAKPAREGPSGRRIIGLDPKVAAEAGLPISGRPPRKRPAVKRKPPRKTFGIKRSGDEDER